MIGSLIRVGFGKGGGGMGRMGRLETRTVKGRPRSVLPKES